MITTRPKSFPSGARMLLPVRGTNHLCKPRHNLNVAQQFALSYMRSEYVPEIIVPLLCSKKSFNFPFKEQLFGLHLWFIIKRTRKSDTLEENKKVGQKVSQYEWSEPPALDQSTLLQLISITIFNSIVETGNTIFGHYLLFLFKD